MIDLKNFIELKPAARETPIRVTVYEDGRLMLNSRLNRELAKRDPKLYVSTDGNVFVIDVNGKGKYRFGKTGRIRNEEIRRILKRKTFPVYYEMEWYDDQKLWVGKTRRLGKCPPEK